MKYEPYDSDHERSTNTIVFAIKEEEQETSYGSEDVVEQEKSNDFDEEEEEEEEEEEVVVARDGRGEEETARNVLFDGEDEEEEEEEEEAGDGGGEEEEEEEEEVVAEEEVVGDCGGEEETARNVLFDGGEEEDEEEEEEVVVGEGGGGEERTINILFDEQPPPKRPRNQSPDQISTLHDRVLLHILSFLPMKEVVRTGALSKRFQYLWTSLSTLVFENFDFEENDIGNFVFFVNRTLLLCKSFTLKKFALDFRYKDRFAPDVNLWIRFAAQNNVQDLYLRLGFSRVEPGGHRLPQHLFTNFSLTILSVLNCVVAPSGDVSWRSLKRLSLEYVRLSDEVIAKVLSGCPVLEFLKLNSFTGINRLDVDSASVKKVVIEHTLVGRDEESVLEISAPNLQSLELLGNFSRRKCWLVNVSSLVEANVNFSFDETFGRDSEDDYLKQRDQMTQLFVGLQHVKQLQLGAWCIQVLSIAEVKGLPFPLLSCKHLTIYTYIKKWDIPGIASMLQSSPNLDTLVIDMSSVYQQRFLFSSKFLTSYDFDGENYWKSSRKRIFENWMIHLKTIKIVGFWEVREGFALPLVQFLLENSKVLEKMVIKTGNSGLNRCLTCSISQEFVRFTQKLLSFPRASSRAVVVL